VASLKTTGGRADLFEVRLVRCTRREGALRLDLSRARWAH